MCRIYGRYRRDIKRRKGLALDATKNLEKLFHSHKLTITTKVGVFEAYVSNVFLYITANFGLQKKV